MKINIENTLCEVKSTSRFNKDLKKMARQSSKNINKLIEVVEVLANKKILDQKYNNHKLINDKTFTDCYECHIEPNWLLVYKYHNNDLILLLVATGSHSDLFK